MTVYALLPDAKIPFHTSSGNLANGYQLFVYNAGTTVKATTYTDSTGLSSNTNPIVLNSRGETPYGVYVASGTYKLVLATNTDTDPPGSPIWSQDGITPANDVSVADATEWTALAITPTYISAVSFSVTGNQTAIMQIGRRLKTTNTAGTVYSTITGSSFGAGITTVTVVNDSGTLDSGLSAVSYGFLAPNNPSVPTITGLNALTTPDYQADYLPLLDTSAGQMTKVLARYIGARVSLATAVSLSGATPNLVASGLSGKEWTEIVIEFVGASTNGTDDYLIQIGDTGGFITSGYIARSVLAANAGNTLSTSTAGFVISAQMSGNAFSGVVILTRLQPAALPAGDTWNITGTIYPSTTMAVVSVCGAVTLSSSTPVATLDRIRLATSGANTYDAGTAYVYGRM